MTSHIMNARGVVLHQHGSPPTMEDIQVMGPGPFEVAVRIVAASVCATDGHAIHNRSPIAVVPTVLGHEGAGIVERVGEGVESLKEGDHVVIGPYGPCGACFNCQTGLADLCDSSVRMQGALGIMSDGHTRIRQSETELHAFAGVGALADVAVVREAQAIRISDSLPLDLFCMAGCAVMTGLGAVFNLTATGPGDSIAVVGCGGVGLNIIQGARIAGASTIIAIDRVATKLDLATKLGATHTVDAGADSLLDEVRSIVPRGVDYVFEAVGDATLVGRCMELTRVGGTCVMVGAPPPGAIIPVRREDLMWQRKLVGCLGGGSVPVRDVKRITDLYSTGQLDLAALVGLRLRPEDFAEAFDALETGAHGRSVVHFT